jgi:hypothetical protein
MDILLWLIVAIIALAIVYLCALTSRKSRLPRSAAPPDPKAHGIDLQARRKLHDDVT